MRPPERWQARFLPCEFRRCLSEQLQEDRQASASDTANAQHSVTVSYRDLNLSTVDGATALYRRISGGARLACRERDHSLFEQRHWMSCVQGAIAGAVTTVNNPLLRTVHSRENPRTHVTAMLAR
jgi:UrcA family protein